MSIGLSFISATRLEFELNQRGRPLLSTSFDYINYHNRCHNPERPQLWKDYGPQLNALLDEIIEQSIIPNSIAALLRRLIDNSAKHNDGAEKLLEEVSFLSCSKVLFPVF